MIKDSAKTGVAFQGEIGAYSEEAAVQFFGSEVLIKPCRNLSDVFQVVEKGEVRYGIVPIENSLEGSVNQTYDLLLGSELKVCNEVILKVTHCLIASPSAELNSIKVVYSHPQALAQCRNFLERLQVEEIPTYDTAGSVKMIKEKGLEGSAAIAGERAARIYQMKVLASGIENSPQNFTRFFVLSNQDSPPTGNDKTSLIFSTKHVPGALFKALEGFAVHDVNLTKIESRPIIGKPWEYNFYLDFEGHKIEEKIQKALENLKRNTVFMKLLGSYPKAESI
jgi:chorismate mutase/prephenate dehydratase